MFRPWEEDTPDENVQEEEVSTDDESEDNLEALDLR